MVGGGPANTAKALARLGYAPHFIGGISSDEFGRKIESELKDNGVDLSLSVQLDKKTAFAIANIDSSGTAQYEFVLEGTATFAFDLIDLPHGNPEVIHIGSVATLIEPGASTLLKWLKTKSAPVIFDPNVRPAIENDEEKYRLSIERWIKCASILKLSEDELSFLYGGEGEKKISQWLDEGVELVILTRAEKGLRAYLRDAVYEVPAINVAVVDTIGAGDTIGAVITEGVLTHGLGNLRERALFSVLERAVKAASITCSRSGANPPTHQEIIG